MNLIKSSEQWALVKPDAFLSGSIVQARNVIEMMQQDIAELHKEVHRLESEAETIRVRVREIIWRKRP